MDKNKVQSVKELYTEAELRSAWSLIWDLDMKSEELTEAFEYLLKDF